MNYYEHHIGDYAEATAHLSFVEDAAYSRLIRKYYALEGPLPADLRAVQRLICARSEEEREAVQIVLNEFFTLADDGYHNARCDEEIARYREKQEKARNSANARWSKSKTNAGNPDPALPPQSDGKPDAMPTDSEGNANASAEPCERINSECEGNAHQSPDTNTLPKGSYEREPRTRSGPMTDPAVCPTTAPADLTPTPSHRGLAINMHLDLQNELGMFLANARSKGKLSADWNAEFEMWLRRSRNFGNGKDQAVSARRAPAASTTIADKNAAAFSAAREMIFGGGDGSATEREIQP